MSTVEQQFDQRQERNQLGKDAEKLLELAEELHDRCERYDRKSFIFNFVGPLGAFGMIIVGYLITFYSGSNQVIAITGGISGIFYAIAFFSYALLMHRRYSALYKRESRALHSIVSMLREIEQSIAQQEGMSAIEQAEFRIRLARFDIGSADDSRR